MLVLALALVSHPAAAQLSGRQARVEVVSPKAPQPVVADGQRVLAYELHVTNLGAGPLAFREIDVTDGGSSASRLASYRDTALSHLLQRPGTMASTGATRLDPGCQTVVYLWLTLRVQDPVPHLLRHRLLFDILDTADVRRDGGTQSAIDSIVVPVSRDVPVVLRAPLDAGEWLAGSGPSNTSDHRRALSAIDGRAYIAQRFAIDWQMIGRNGNTYHDDEHRNESFWSFGQPVRSVAAGEVIAILDSIPDNIPRTPLPPPTLRTIAGNFVVIRIRAHQYATYAHLQHGSIRVRVHQHLGRGDVIGLLGNSGQSTAPHLHFQVTDGPSVLGSEGIPYVLAAYNFLGWAKDFEERTHPTIPRRRELPVEDAVVGLP
jgi:murein DD-endopeptidase